MRVLVLGAGVVGEATGKGLLQFKNQVTFADINPQRVTSLTSEGLTAIGPDAIDLAQYDVCFVAVTALTSPGAGVDLTNLMSATTLLGDRLRLADCAIVYRCTMPPGTMRTVLIPLLESGSGKKAEVFGVGYSPEYLRANSAYQDYTHPRVITMATLAADDYTHQQLRTLMSPFGVDMPWFSLEALEFQKYVSNVFNAAKISLINAFRQTGIQLGIEPSEVQRAIETTLLTAEGLWNARYGIRDFGPYGGACLPKDTQAWIYYLQQQGLDASLFLAVQRVNQELGGE